MTEAIYYLLSGAGALLGGLAAWRTRNSTMERKDWERIYRAMASENKVLRDECRKLRSALREALIRVRQLS